MDIKNLLLPRDKFFEVFNQYGHSPFTFEIKKGHQVMFYFGANHSHNPENHQYAVLREYWNRFLKETSGAEKMILVEDSMRPIEIDECTAIRRGAEGSAVALWGYQNNIQHGSPDITIEELAKRFPMFPEDEVLLYRFINIVHNFQKHHLSGTFEDVVERWCKEKRQKGFDVSLEKFKFLYKKILNKDFDETEDMTYLVNPNKTGTRINEIARLLSDAREVNIVSEIERLWKEGKSLFVVFGSGHLIIQRPALERLLV